MTLTCPPQVTLSVDEQHKERWSSPGAFTLLSSSQVLEHCLSHLFFYSEVPVKCCAVRINCLPEGWKNKKPISPTFYWHPKGHLLDPHTQNLYVHCHFPPKFSTTFTSTTTSPTTSSTTSTTSAITTGVCGRSSPLPPPPRQARSSTQAIPTGESISLPHIYHMLP